MPRIDALPDEYQRAIHDYTQAWASSPEDLRCLELTSESDPNIAFDVWLARVMTVSRRPRPLELALYAVSKGQGARAVTPYRFGDHHAPQAS